MSPGAALVFLLAGPATNVASITVLTGVLGKRGVIVYLASIAIFAVLLGMCTDLLYGLLEISLQSKLAAGMRDLLPGWIHLGTAVLLAILMVSFFLRKVTHVVNTKIKSDAECCS